MKLIRQTLMAAATATAVLPMQVAQAQTAASVVGMPRVSEFGVRQVGRIEPGVELDFTVMGTPGAQASLQIDGAQRPLYLAETSPGRYEGTYTVGQRDRITPDGRVTANLRRNNQVGTALLSMALQQDWPSPLAVNTVPQIDSVAVTNVPGRNWRNSFRYTLKGTPGGVASVQIEGTQPRTLTLDEVRRGEYAGTYVLPSGQWLNTNRALTARLRVGERTTVSTLDRAYEGVRMADKRTDRRWDRWPANCANCGHVEAVNAVQVDGNGRVLGTLAGGVLGAAVGNQFGKGDGRTASTVVGAVGGALLGREIERRSNQRTQYEVVVRTDAGAVKTVTYDTAPTLKVGDAVRVLEDNRIELFQD